jgi:hypothetical protein
MPLAKQRITKDRQQFYDSLTVAEVKSLVTDTDIHVLQTSSHVDSKTWDMLNENLFSIRHDIELRIHSLSNCDLSFLSQLSNVRHFSADCLMTAHGIENIVRLKNLKSLSIGIYDLESFDFLNDLPTDQIQKLCIRATKSKRPSLAPLKSFKNLKILFIEGQQKEIDIISSLYYLEDLTLRSVSPNGLGFLRNLKNLWSLDIKLGGIQDISALNALNGIKYLELWQVKGLSDLSVISTMVGLQYLFLQSLRNVVNIPDLSKLLNLRRIYLDNMKSLKDMSPVTSAPALEEFTHIQAQGMKPQDYQDVLNMKSLKKANVGFGSSNKNSTFRELAAKHGIEDLKGSPFSFV